MKLKTIKMRGKGRAPGNFLKKYLTRANSERLLALKPGRNSSYFGFISTVYCIVVYSLNATIVLVILARMDL